LHILQMLSWQFKVFCCSQIFAHSSLFWTQNPYSMISRMSLFWTFLVVHNFLLRTFGHIYIEADCLMRRINHLMPLQSITLHFPTDFVSCDSTPRFNKSWQPSATWLFTALWPWCS
jgi:hypothetical protein